MLAKFPCPVRCTVLAQEGLFGMLVLFEQCSGVLPRFWPRLVAVIGSFFFGVLSRGHVGCESAATVAAKLPAVAG